MKSARILTPGIAADEGWQYRGPIIPPDTCPAVEWEVCNADNTSVLLSINNEMVWLDPDSAIAMGVALKNVAEAVKSYK